MGNQIEREVKLSFASAEAAREAVGALGAAPLRARRLQDDRLFDTPGGRLRGERCTLRVRLERPARPDGAAGDSAAGGDSGGAGGTIATLATLTFKGPPQPDVMKVREEIETTAGDGAALLRVFEKAGFEVWFRYQKYREEFAHGDTIVAIDETPCGVFVELEGSEAGVTQLARALGRTPSDYITASYRSVYETDCAARGVRVTHMVFEPSTDRLPKP